jgi:hypothetical protein
LLLLQLGDNSVRPTPKRSRGTDLGQFGTVPRRRQTPTPALSTVKDRHGDGMQTRTIQNGMRTLHGLLPRARKRERERERLHGYRCWPFRVDTCLCRSLELIGRTPLPSVCRLQLRRQSKTVVYSTLSKPPHPCRRCQHRPTSLTLLVLNDTIYNVASYALRDAQDVPAALWDQRLLPKDGSSSLNSDYFLINLLHRQRRQLNANQTITTLQK